MTIPALLLAALPAAAQTAAERDAALGAPFGTAVGTPVNEAEVRDVAVGAPRPVDRAPFTPISTSELGRVGQAGDALTPVPPALGQGIWLGRNVTLSPYYRGGVFYDSNIFRDPDDLAVDDWEVINTVGADLTIVGRRFELEAGYAGSSRLFVDQDTSTEEHRARLTFAAVGRSVSIRTRAAFAWLARPDDPRFEGRATVKRTIYDVGGAVAIRLTRTISLLPEFFGVYQDMRGEEFDFADYASYGGNLLLSLAPRGRVAVIGGFGVRELIYTNDEAQAPDLRIYSVLVGLESRFLRSLTGQVRVGYEWGEILERRDFPDDEDPPEGFVASAALRWQVLRMTAFTLDGTRQVDFSTTTSPVWRTRVTVGIEQALLTTLGATVRVSWEEIEGIDGQRDRLRSWLVAGGLAWAPRPWFQVGVLGSYLSRDSGGGQSGFDVTRVGVALTLRY